jgi:hypothetical protein
MSGVMAVGVQVVFAVTVSATFVLEVKLPDVPLMVTVDEPVAAELLAVSVRTLDFVAGLVPKAAVTPLGNPSAASVTPPLNPPASVTEMVSVLFPPCAIESAVEAGERVKLPDTGIVMVKVSLPAQPLVLV